MARAEHKSVPKPILAEFRKPDPGKDQEAFWTQLNDWYRNDDGSWYAAWDGFFFPPFAEFEEAVFRGKTSIRGATFAGPVEFHAAHFETEVKFEGTSFFGIVGFVEAQFTQEVSFREVRFEDDVAFAKARFLGDAWFFRTKFLRGAFFNDAQFRKADFIHARFEDMAEFADARFGGQASFTGSNFERTAAFDGAEFQGAEFADVTFGGRTNFFRAQFEGAVDFHNAVAKQNLSFDGSVVSQFLRLGLQSLHSLTLNGLGSKRDTEAEREDGEEWAVFGAPIVLLGPMSLRGVSLSKQDARNFRFHHATDIEHLVLTDVWGLQDEKGRCRVADHHDVDHLDSEDAPTEEEVERIYGGLRKGHEERGDRVGAHGWYFAEMEVGRQNARPWSLRKLARTIYWGTSSYGLSAMRPSLWLAALLLGGATLFLVGGRAICPLVANACAGWDVIVETTIFAVFLQPLPEDVAFAGFAGSAVWLLIRLVGAFLLLSLGIAFRNQVAR